MRNHSPQLDSGDWKIKIKSCWVLIYLLAVAHPAVSAHVWSWHQLSLLVFGTRDYDGHSAEVTRASDSHTHHTCFNLPLPPSNKGSPALTKSDAHYGHRITDQMCPLEVACYTLRQNSKVKRKEENSLIKVALVLQIFRLGSCIFVTVHFIMFPYSTKIQFP